MVLNQIVLFGKEVKTQGIVVPRDDSISDKELVREVLCLIRQMPSGNGNNLNTSDVNRIFNAAYVPTKDADLKECCSHTIYQSVDGSILIILAKMPHDVTKEELIAVKEEMNDFFTLWGNLKKIRAMLN